MAIHVHEVVSGDESLKNSGIAFLHTQTFGISQLNAEVSKDLMNSIGKIFLLLISEPSRSGPGEFQWLWTVAIYATQAITVEAPTDLVYSVKSRRSSPMLFHNEPLSYNQSTQYILLSL